MLFDIDEVLFLTSALETYNEKHRKELRPELQDELAKSAIRKLENLTPLTYFTKQEFSIMALATHFIINALEKSGNVVDAFTLSLFEKVVSLC